MPFARQGHFKASAVVLGSTDYAESDRILTFYTREYGKIRGIARGARRSKRRFVGNLDPLSRISLGFHYNGRSELVRVESAELKGAFAALRADIDRLTSACYLLELVSELTPDAHAAPGVYELLVGFLGLLEAPDGDDPALLRFFEIKLLGALGYLPHLSGCVICKREFIGAQGERVPLKRFCSTRGGVVCAQCSGGTDRLLPISPATARLLSAAYGADVDKLSGIETDAAFLDQSERILDDFIKHQTGKELKTRKFMNKMRSAGSA